MLTDGNSGRILALEHPIRGRCSHGTVRWEYTVLLVKIQCCLTIVREMARILRSRTIALNREQWPERTEPLGEAPSVLDRDPEQVKTSLISKFPVL
jgi:hypothetical protein